MKKHNAAKSLALALGSAALLWGTINLQAGTTLPPNAAALRANGGTTWTLAPTTDPSVFTHTVDGITQVSLLGNCTFHADVVVQFPAAADQPIALTGSAVFTAADGTTLKAALVGEGTPDPAGAKFLNFHYHATFSGGSGPFANARGEGDINGAALFVTDFSGKATWTMKGYVLGTNQGNQ